MKKIILLLIIIVAVIKVNAQTIPFLDYKPAPSQPQNNSSTNNYINEYNQREDAQMQEAIRNDRNQMINKMNNVINIYNSYSKFPDIIKDGWHNVYAINKQDFCKQAKVYVENNKITRFTYSELQFEIKNLTSYSIKNGIGIVSYSESSTEYLLYAIFLEDIDNVPK